MSAANRAMDRMRQLSGVNVSQNHCELVLDGWMDGWLVVYFSIPWHAVCGSQDIPDIATNDRQLSETTLTRLNMNVAKP